MNYFSSIKKPETDDKFESVPFQAKKFGLAANSSGSPFYDLALENSYAQTLVIHQKNGNVSILPYTLMTRAELKGNDFIIYFSEVTITLTGIKLLELAEKFQNLRVTSVTESDGSGFDLMKDNVLIIKSIKIEERR